MFELAPVIGAAVAKKDDERRERLGLVQRLGDKGSGLAGVVWNGETQIRFEPISELTSGLKMNMEVLRRPQSSVHEEFRHRDLSGPIVWWADTLRF
ncbi:MAG: hypothetical protein U5L08_07740 [Xanthomonadales bacterium]|nr:hypothetical protein [Xanthomonadales bacterium]